MRRFAHTSAEKARRGDIQFIAAGGRPILADLDFYRTLLGPFLLDPIDREAALHAVGSLTTAEMVCEKREHSWPLIHIPPIVFPGVTGEGEVYSVMLTLNYRSHIRSF